MRSDVHVNEEKNIYIEKRRNRTNLNEEFSLWNKSLKEKSESGNKAAKDAGTHSREIFFVVCIFQVALVLLILVSKYITQGKVW